MNVLYNGINGIGRVCLPENKQRVLQTPSVYSEPENSYSDEPLEPFFPVEISPAVYRDETETEQLLRMIDAGHLPGLPWSNYLELPDNHPAMTDDIALITVSDWKSLASLAIAPAIIRSDDVNTERARRIGLGITVPVTGIGIVSLQGDAQSRENLSGLYSAALGRMIAGQTTHVTTFRDADNRDHKMVPLQIMEMWGNGGAYVEAVYKASWAIKALQPIPVDYADDSHWPDYN